MGKLIRGFGNLVKTSFRKMTLPIDDPNQYLGKTILASVELDGPLEEIVISDIRGCLGMGNMSEVERSRLIRTFQINGTHYVPMFSFYTQMREGRLPTKEETDEFELTTQIVKIKEIGGK